MNIYHGNIVTCNKKNEVASYLIEDEGLIRYVGNDLPKEYQNRKLTELGDRALMPSFADTHLHFASMALFQSGINVMNVSSNEEIKACLTRFLPNAKGKVAIAFGASPHSVKERKLLSRTDLDMVSKDKPIMVVKYDGHACIINTALMNALPEKVKIMRGYNKDSGEMNQEAFFATALDGCFGSVDAALLQPYEGTDESGILYYSDEEVIDFCKRANRQGLQIELHAIGDAAFDQAAKALKAALEEYPREDHRHGIIHACLPTKEGLEICKQYKIHIPLQTSFIVWPQEPDWYLRDILGERESLLNPLRSFLDNNIVISAGSDSPCTDPDPMLWIHNSCNHPVKEQALTVDEALRMATYWGYWTSFDEKERGSLEKGKIADMVILSSSPLKTSLDKLKDIKVEKLILAGKPYEGQKQSWGRMLLKGFLSRGKV